MKKSIVTIILSLTFLVIGSNAFGWTYIGTSGPDTITGSWLGDTIYGLAGNDYLYGLEGWDIINGDEGDDHLSGHAGYDWCYGGIGSDVSSTCEYNEGVEQTFRVSMNSRGNSGPSNLTVIAHDDLDVVIGGAGLTIILFPADNMELDDINSEANEEVVVTFADNEKTLNLVTGALSYAKVSELVLDQAVRV